MDGTVWVTVDIDPNIKDIKHGEWQRGLATGSKHEAKVISEEINKAVRRIFNKHMKLND